MTRENTELAGAVERLKNRDHVVPMQTARLVDQDDLDAALTALSPSVEVERLREALRPFALAAENMDGDEPDTLFIYDSPESAMIDYGDLRRARAALSRKQEPGVPTPGEWIEWSGGPNPVPGQIVDWRNRVGMESTVLSDRLSGWEWPHVAGPDNNIIAYRIVPTPGGEG